VLVYVILDPAQTGELVVEKEAVGVVVEYDIIGICHIPRPKVDALSIPVA